MRFCPSCGFLLGYRNTGGRDRPHCRFCEFTYFADPKVAVAVVVRRGDTVLLARRINEPGAGKWSLPGGFVDRGETPLDAAARELREETGLCSDSLTLLDVYAETGNATVLIVFVTSSALGAPAGADDVDGAQFFERNHLPVLAFKRDRDIIARV